MSQYPPMPVRPVLGSSETPGEQYQRAKYRVDHSEDPRICLVEQNFLQQFSINVSSYTASPFGDVATVGSVDKSVIMELRLPDSSVGIVLLQEIVMAIYSSSTQLLLRLRAAISDGDSDVIDQIAHALKRSSSQVCLKYFSAICAELIAASSLGKLENLVPIFERRTIEHAAVISGLDKELHASTA